MKYFSIAFMVVVFSLEIIAQCYSSNTKSMAKIQHARQAAINAFVNSGEAVKRRAQRDSTITRIDESSRAKIQRNFFALASSNASTREMYDEKIRQDADKKSKVMAEYDRWESAAIANIKKEYAEIEFYQSHGSFLADAYNWGLGIMTSILALFLAAVSPRYNGLRRYAALAGAIIAQMLASLLAFDGIVAKKDETTAYVACLVFFYVIPVAYHFMSDVAFQLPHVTVQQSRRPKYTHEEFQISANGWVNAIQELATQRRLGNGSGQFSKVSGMYGINRGIVHRQVMRALAGKPITVPAKLLKRDGETVAIDK